RIRAVATKEKPVKIREPLFERCKALAVTPTFALEYGRRFIGAVEVEIDIVTGATEARGAGAWIAFTAKPKLAVPVDKLALDAIAFPAGTSAPLLSRRGRRQSRQRGHVDPGEVGRAANHSQPSRIRRCASSAGPRRRPPILWCEFGRL